MAWCKRVRFDTLGLVKDREYQRTLKRLSATLKARRRELAWTQEEVAEELDIVVRQYQKIEAGEVNLTLRSLVRIARVFGVDPRDLL